MVLMRSVLLQRECDGFVASSKADWGRTAADQQSTTSQRGIGR